MSGKDDWSSEWGIVVGAAGLVLIIAVVVFGIILLPFIAVIVFVLGGIYYHYHSPAYLERKAQEHTQALYDQVKDIAGPSKIEWGVDLYTLYPEQDLLVTAGLDLFDLEGYDGPAPPPKIANSIEGARYRDSLAKFSAYDPERYRAFKRVVVEALDQLQPVARGGGEFEIEETLTRERVEELIETFYGDDTLFVELRKRFDRNLKAQDHVLPKNYEGDNVTFAYLKDTPLLEIAKRRRWIALKNRTEHMHIVAGSGHGKTQTLQYLIARDIARADCSVVVIDSQNQLISNIAHLDIPAERIVLIDPHDIEHPPALNLFDAKMERINKLSPLDRERTINQVIELYDFVFGALLGAELTSKQSVVFRYITRLMLHIPGATIHTLVDLMRPKATDTPAIRDGIAQLEGTAREFFETDFNHRQFDGTKDEVLRRLYGVLENGIFNRIMSNTESRVDFLEAINEPGKVILVNTARDLLMGEGTRIFGRFIIAMIRQAVQQRPPGHEVPCYIYIDEFGDYLSGSHEESVETMLVQARKQNAGIILSHQYMGQLSAKLTQAIASNTAIKFAGGVSAQDARMLAPQLRTTADFIEEQSKGRFAARIKGSTEEAVSLRVPFGVLEGLPKREDYDEFLARMREWYGTPPKPAPTVGDGFTMRDSDPPSPPEASSSDPPSSPVPSAPHPSDMQPKAW